MAKMIKLAAIKAPDLYIRQDVDAGHVQDLRDVLTTPDNANKAYPFHDAIMVRKLAKPEKVKVAMSNKPGTVEYELIRGFNRCMALAAEKWTEASADIVEVGDAEAFAMQYDDPEVGTIKKHGLADRNFYIRTLRDNFSWKLADIASRMKLTEASVSRILAEKQASGKKKPRRARRKGSKPTATNGAAETGFLPAEFFKILGELVAAYADHKDAVMGFVDKVDPNLIAGSEAMIAELLGNR